MDSTDSNEIFNLTIYLVDYGSIIPNIIYHLKSTNLKFLHKNFSTLSTQVYDCRLVNIRYPVTSIQWSDDARQFITDLCSTEKFSVQIVGFIESFYCIYLYIDDNRQQSINQLLIQHGFAVEFDDFNSHEVKKYFLKIKSLFSFFCCCFFSSNRFYQKRKIN